MRPGEKTRRQRAVLTGRALGVAAVAVPRALRGPRPGPDRPLYPRPDSPLCAAADDLAAERLTAPLLRHSRRCWQWAMALAEVDGLDPDREALYVACLLHDVALGSHDPHLGCFATAGGDQAAALCRAYGQPALAEVVRAAVAGHFEPVAGPGAVDRTLHDATHVDVVGYRARDLTRPFAQRVLADAPRTGLRADLLAALRTEAALRPRSTAATLYRTGMALPMALNPLDRLAPTSG